MGSALSQALRSTWLINLVWTGGGVLALGLGALYYYQDNLLYHPFIPGVPKTPRDNPPGFRSPEDHGIVDYEEHFIKTEDGATLHAWLMLHRDAESLPTVVYFHGNAGNMGFRLPHGTNIYKQCRANVLLMDYRGYGSSQGTPSEPGLLADARAVLATLRGHPRLAKDKIVLYGKSLGGAVALALAEERPHEISALVLENTFLSIPAMVDVVLPFVKFFKGLILRIGWHSDKRVGKLAHPILFISGLADELVPPFHMRELKRLAKKSVLAELYTVADGTHNDTMFRGGIAYYRTYRDFLGKVLKLVAEGKVVVAEATCTTEMEGDDDDADAASDEKKHLLGKEGSIPIMPSHLYNIPTRKKDE